MAASTGVENDHVARPNFIETAEERIAMRGERHVSRLSGERRLGQMTHRPA